MFCRKCGREVKEEWNMSMLNTILYHSVISFCSSIIRII